MLKMQGVVLRLFNNLCTRSDVPTAMVMAAIFYISQKGTFKISGHSLPIRCAVAIGGSRGGNQSGNERLGFLP